MHDNFKRKLLRILNEVKCDVYQKKLNKVISKTKKYGRIQIKYYLKME